MSAHNIRLSSILSFDEEQEKDIIKLIERLNSSHKTGQWLSNLIRIALDNPEIMETKNGKFRQGDILKQLESNGISFNRKLFMNSVSQEVSVMKNKVDSIYSMVFKMYMLAQMGKHLELDKKSDNLLMATFILEKQLKDLQDTLGVDLVNSQFLCNKKEDIHKKADDILEYIIEAYSGIIEELKNQMTTTATTVSVVNNPVVEQVPIIQQPIVNPVMQQVAKTNEVSSDEIIDFGEADIGLLGNFFGD